jgi:hypothetical protein
VSDSTPAEAIDRYERELLDLAAVFDEPVAAEDYPLALLSLGHRSRTLFRAFLELHAGDAATASRTLLRPLVEINLLVRFLRKDPSLHTELWQAEGDRNSVVMAEEVRRSPQLRERLGEDPLSDEELDRRRASVDAARALGVAAGLPVKRGAVLPSTAAQLAVIDEPAARAAYAFAYRLTSWDVHAGPRAFLVGSFEIRKDGSVSYEERPTPESLLPGRALAIGTFASTIELIAAEFRLGIEEDARDIRLAIMGTPAAG